MKLKHLSIMNFLSIGHIELDLDNRGLVLLQGVNKDNNSLNNNGAGKSSILEAIIYALYSRTIRGLKADAVVHRLTGKNMAISLDIEDDNGNVYSIYRFRKHDKYKNKSVLLCNDVDITPKSEADFNDKVADILQADYLTFTSSILYSADSFKFTSATDGEMKATFDKMLGLEIYSKCLEIARTRIKNLEGDITTQVNDLNALQSKLDGFNTNLKAYKEKDSNFVQALKEKEESLKSRIAEYQKDNGSKEDEIHTLNEEIESYKKRRISYEEKLNDRLKYISKTSAKIQACKDRIAEIKDEIPTHKEKAISIGSKIDNAKDKLEMQQGLLNDVIAEIEETKNATLNVDAKDTICPTCGQVVKADHTHLLEELKQKQEDKLNSLIKKKKEIKEKIKTIQESITNNTDELETVNGEIATLTTELEDLSKNLTKEELAITTGSKAKYYVEKEKLELSIKKIDEFLNKQEVVIEGIQKAIEQNNKFIAQLQEDLNTPTENPYTDIIKDIENNIDTTNESISTITDALTDVMEQKAVLKFWEQAYSNQGIKSLILDDITPFLNKRVNKYLSKLASGHIEVNFTTQQTLKSGEKRDKFAIEIINKDGGQEYSANSSGEKKRVDLAVNMALQDLLASRSNKKINLCLLDEVVDSLDQVGIESVVELLKDMEKEKSSVFIISHNENLKSYFTNTITVVKENGYSHLA